MMMMMMMMMMLSCGWLINTFPFKNKGQQGDSLDVWLGSQGVAPELVE